MRVDQFKPDQHQRSPRDRPTDASSYPGRLRPSCIALAVVVVRPPLSLRRHKLDALVCCALKQSRRLSLVFGVQRFGFLTVARCDSRPAVRAAKGTLGLALPAPLQGGQGNKVERWLAASLEGVGVQIVGRPCRRVRDLHPRKVTRQWQRQIGLRLHTRENVGGWGVREEKEGGYRCS